MKSFVIDNSICLLAAMILFCGAGTACAQSDFPVLTIPQYSSPPVYVAPEYQGPVQNYPMTAPQYPGVILSAPIDRSTRRPATSRTPRAGDFSLTLRTDLMSAFVNRSSVESDSVNTRVMEADVRGVQTTSTAVRLESTDSRDRARLHIRTSGNVASNTVGYTRQAQIASTGNHTFEVIKPVFFDGERFLTKSAYGRLQVQQTPHTINTVASGLPLLGAIGQRVAWNQVNRRAPVTDSIVARQVADDVLPRVNSSVDSALADLNRGWRKLRRQIDDVIGREQLKWSASSTPQSFSTTAINSTISARAIDPNSQLLAELSGPEAAAIVFSEDGLNEILRRLPLKGAYISDASLQRLATSIKSANGDFTVIRDAFKNVLTDKIDAAIFAVEFSEDRPLEIHLEDGLVAIDARFRVVPPIGEPSPLQLVRVNISGEDRGDGNWAIVVRDITCEPVNRDEAPGMWTTTINTQAKNILPNIPAADLPRRIDVRHLNPKMPVVRLHRIQTENAQLRISYKLDDPSPMDVVTGRPTSNESPVDDRVRTFGPAP